MGNVGTRISKLGENLLLGAKLSRAYPFQYKTSQSACKKIQSLPMLG